MSAAPVSAKYLNAGNLSAKNLTVENLTVKYTNDSAASAAVEQVGFTLRPGESAALIGANGAGKTTLLLALVGVVPAITGEIKIGPDVLSKKTLRGFRSRIGLVFQNPDDQLFMPSIYEDVAFGPRSFGCSEAETEARVEGALRALGIAHLRGRSPLKLSGGEKRLCAIATALAMEPEYLLLDEPTAFLDPRARRGLAATLSTLKQGKLIATHDLPFAESACGRVLALRGGRLIADGGPALLRDAAALEAAGL